MQRGPALASGRLPVLAWPGRWRARHRRAAQCLDGQGATHAPVLARLAWAGSLRAPRADAGMVGWASGGVALAGCWGPCARRGLTPATAASAPRWPGPLALWCGDGRLLLVTRHCAGGARCDRLTRRSPLRRPDALAQCLALPTCVLRSRSVTRIVDSSRTCYHRVLHGVQRWS